MRTTYIIPEPADIYGVRLIELIYYKFGIRPICLFTWNKKSYYLRRQYSIFNSDMIEGAYYVPKEELGQFAQWVKRQYHVLGVVAHIEFVVDIVADLMESLDLDWNTAEVLHRFRDKHSMKSFLQGKNPELNMPESHIVKNVDEIMDYANSWEKLVLKPNDGTGNTHVGIFENSVSKEALQAHLDNDPSSKWVLEEYIEGEEYCINGHVGSAGNVMVNSIYQYGRTWANGRDAMYVREYHVKQTTEAFGTLSSYAQKVIQGLELRHSPFHMEVKVDNKGPRLIDLGARLEGNDGVFVSDWLHPQMPSSFEIAAHGYLFRDNLGVQEPDWSNYNDSNSLKVYGIASQDAIVHRVGGIQEVESLPSFARWYIKPQIGQKITKTLDLLSMPYAVYLIDKAPMESLLEDENYVRQTLTWNGDKLKTYSIDRAKGYVSFLKDKMVPKMSWWAHRTVGYNDILKSYSSRLTALACIPSVLGMFDQHIFNSICF
ncbi:MAG: ATP-grasp domain-containing protein [Anaerolineaceae bacterium]|nr:ATP-grasp domain-containing protein [Anaerolineaceae bacterium]